MGNGHSIEDCSCEDSSSEGERRATTSKEKEPVHKQEKKVEEQSQLSTPNEPKTCTAGEDSSNVECVPDDDNGHSIENSSCEDSSNEGERRATTSKEKAPIYKQEKKVEEHSQLSPPNEPKTCTAGEDSSNVECVPDDANGHSIEDCSCEDSSSEGERRATTSKEKEPVHKQEKKVEEQSQLSTPN